METVKRPVVASAGEGKINRWGTGDLEGHETILYDYMMVETCHYTLVKTHGIYNANNEPYLT